MRSPQTFNAAYAQSLTEHALRRFSRLCEAAAFDGEGAARAHAVFRTIVLPAIASTPCGWTSDISDEQTPIEFSVALHGERAEVRVLFEAQGEINSLASFRKSALTLNDQIAAKLGADLAKFKEVADLFLPMRMAGPFAMWHSLVFKRDGIDAKVYFNAQARGLGRAYSTVEEALHRLGMAKAWPSMMRSSLSRGPKLDEIKYLALDLSSDTRARVKVYVRHHAASMADLERACSASQEYVPGEATDFARAMSGGAETLGRRAPFTCSAFSGASLERPSATTLYVPACAYADDDATLTNRVTTHLARRGFAAGAYHHLIAKYADRDLSSGIGMQSWLALRRLDNRARLTVYLSSESRGSLQPGTIPAPTEGRTVYSKAQEVVADLGRYPLSAHPVIRLLRQRGKSRALASAVAPLAAHASSLRAASGSLTPRRDSPTPRAGSSTPPPFVAVEDVVRSILTDDCEVYDWMRQSAQIRQAARAIDGTWAEITGQPDLLKAGAAIATVLIAAEQVLTALAAPRATATAPSTRALDVARIDAGLASSFAALLAAQNVETPEDGDVERVAAGVVPMHDALWGLLDAVYTYLGCGSAPVRGAR